MAPQPTLWYSTIGILTGLCFHIGETVLFAPCDEDALLIVADVKALTITAQVPSLFATFIRETIIEKRLASLGGRP